MSGLSADLKHNTKDDYRSRRSYMDPRIRLSLKEISQPLCCILEALESRPKAEGFHRRLVSTQAS
jgi:hypothetical protein